MLTLGRVPDEVRSFLLVLWLASITVLVEHVNRNVAYAFLLFLFLFNGLCLPCDELLIVIKMLATLMRGCKLCD